jgi:putative ABC transport system permease protein
MTMHLRETTRTAWRSLTSNKLRTGLTGLGIIIGVGAVVAVLAIGEGASASIEDDIRSLGANLMMVRPGAASFGPVRTATAVDTLRPNDADAIGALDGVDVVAPTMTGMAQIKYRGENVSASVVGITADYLVVRSVQVDQGLSFTSVDDQQRSRVAILGSNVERDLFGEGRSGLGERIQIKGVAFRVVGVLAEQGSAGFQSTDDQVFVPLSTHEGVLFGQDYLTAIYLTMEDEGDTGAITQRIAQVLRLRHRLRADEDDDFNVTSQTEMLERMGAITGTLTLLLGAVAAVSLLVGGIGIMNIMLVSVRERTREIGVRMAVGAKRSDILMQFLVEAVIVSVVGGVIGGMLGYLGAAAIAVIGGWETSVPAYAPALAISVSVFIGVAFGVGPARGAARLNPVDALRHE